MPHLFSENSYDTPDNRRDLRSRLLLNCRLNFHLQIWQNFYRIGRQAKNGLLSRGEQIRFSEKNVDILERCGAKIHLRGLENLSAGDGPFVLAGNHMSAVESLVLNAIISPRLDFTYVIKSNTFSVPFLRQAMRAMNAIGIDRDNPREDLRTVLSEGRRRLESGSSVLIFPEGGRHAEFVPERFNSIAVKLARAAKVELLPFALKTDFLPRGNFSRLQRAAPRTAHILFLRASGRGRRQRPGGAGKNHPFHPGTNRPLELTGSDSPRNSGKTDSHGCILRFPWYIDLFITGKHERKQRKW